MSRPHACRTPPDRPRLCHVCLAGPALTRDLRLIDALRGDNQLTLIERVEALDARALESVDVLALDGEADADELAARLRELRQARNGVYLVVVNGSLAQADVARAFRAGADDYFPAASAPGLLAERLAGLCRQARVGVLAARGRDPAGRKEAAG